MRRTALCPLSALMAIAAGALVATDATHAAAGWPPPESATSKDMMDPANWPNDPGYGYSDDNSGQWNFYSFVPKPASDIKPRPDETASGMSIDLAWRHTIGDPRVVILVTDSGIKWDEADLIDKAWLNYKELGSHRPLSKLGGPCKDLDPAKQPGIKDPISAEELDQLKGFDCWPIDETTGDIVGDGILTVSDYQFTTTLTPAASDGHPLGDRNGNHFLDAGDLILNFSDSIDDDQNGYVDDISGWDFMKGDNDPFDDTLYGHGSGEANDSVRQANNGLGEAGVCPLCRFMAGRAGDSFIADVQAFGQAVVYATDNHVSIVQCALGTINMTEFAQEALDYAYSKDVLVVTSMADENSRHHNMPAASNHTLPVHAIQYDGTEATKSTTFFQYHPCSNYGGQNLLSASGTGCSSEATGMLSGISGLVYSASLKYLTGAVPPKPALTAAEAQQIFFSTADDIDVPESRDDPESAYSWSQEGFDQRFGYGRVNADAAVTAIKEGKIPPAVDITSPTWFQVLYKDRVTGPIDILGTVSAKRSTSYDVSIEWAPGVQPLDGEFEVFFEQKNIPGETTLGGTDAPLASLDIRNVDPTHERDKDSPHGENDDTITVRVRAIAHYGGAIGNVQGEMRRTYYVHSDPALAKGFPIFLGDSGEGSPKMADLDGDGVRELVYPTSGGLLHAYKLTADGPQELPGFPFETSYVDGLADMPPTPTTPDYTKAPGYASGDVDKNLGREALTTAPAIDDLDGDGEVEIVVSTWSGTVYVIGPDGKSRPGWPKRLPEVPSCPTDPTLPKTPPCMDIETRIARGAFAAPVLVDLDGDKKLDIVQAAFDGNVYAWDAAGTSLKGWPVAIHYKGPFGPEPKRSRILTTPAVADFNGDKIPDLLVGSNEKLGKGEGSGAIYLIDGRGTATPNGPVLPGWPITLTSLQLFPLVAEGIPNSGVVGHFEGKLAAVMHGNASAPLVLPADPGEQTGIGETPTNALPQRPDPDDPTLVRRGVDPTSIFGRNSKLESDTMFPLFAQPSLGDIDQDGVPDVVASGGSLSLASALQSNSGATGNHLLAIWSGKTGAMMPASPMVLEDYTFFNSQAIVDLNGDGYPEVITGSGGYFLHAFDGCGREPEGWPKFTGQWIIPTAAVGDLDGDHTLEVAVGTRDGWLYVWHTEATDDATIEWESFHHDNRNTGSLDTPLTQGGHKKAAKPLTWDMCTPVPEDTHRFEVGGGCNCTASGDGPSRQALGVSLAAACLAFLRRKRRR